MLESGVIFLVVFSFYFGLFLSLLVAGGLGWFFRYIHAYVFDEDEIDKITGGLKLL